MQVHALGNQEERARKQSVKTRIVFDLLGRNGGQRENLRDRLNARRRSPECELVNNQEQDRLLGNIRVVDFKEGTLSRILEMPHYPQYLNSLR